MQSLKSMLIYLFSKDVGLPKLSEIDCSSAELPTVAAKPKPKQRKWVYKWSSHCKVSLKNYHSKRLNLL